MIDFRYHLVSIVSIFLALAVGIALGAGPLKSTIGDTFTSELTSLRADKQALKEELDRTKAASEKRDAFTSAGNQVLLAGRLSGMRIALVVLPGADNNLVVETDQTITAAGAEVTGTVRVQQAWVQRNDERAALTTELAGQLGVTVPTGGSVTLDEVLARALQPKSEGVQVDETKAKAVIATLRDKGYIRQDPSVMLPAEAVVVVSAPVTGSTAASRTTMAGEFAQLAGALDSAGRGAVVISDVGTGTTATKEDVASVVSAIRQDDQLSDDVTTIDDGTVPMGQASVVFGILEQLGGQAGQYGLAQDAKAAFPAIPGLATP